MGEIFLKLLNMSITASWIILAVLGIRLLFRRIPKWITCLLWGVVAIRLIFPFSIESVFSLQPSAEPIRTSTMVEGELIPYVPSVDSNIGVVENTINPALAETFAYQETQSVAPLQIVTEIAGGLWLCGMVVLLILALVSMIKLRLCVREAVLYRENIYICDAVKSPFILGIIRPRIYLSSSLSEEEMAYIIAHESAHLKRKDHLWKPFGYLLLCIYWFNPLCWVAYIMLCKDIELACDEKVIRDMNFEDKKKYSRVLLSCATQRRLVMMCPLAFGEVGVKDRVKLVLNYKKPSFWIVLISMAACVVVAVCFLTEPKSDFSIADYKAISYREYQKLTGYDAEFYHALYYIGELPKTELSIVFEGDLKAVINGLLQGLALDQAVHGRPQHTAGIYTVHVVHKARHGLCPAGEQPVRKGGVHMAAASVELTGLREHDGAVQLTAPVGIAEKVSGDGVAAVYLDDPVAEQIHAVAQVVPEIRFFQQQEDGRSGLFFPQPAVLIGIVRAVGAEDGKVVVRHPLQVGDGHHHVQTGVQPETAPVVLHIRIVGVAVAVDPVIKGIVDDCIAHVAVLGGEQSRCVLQLRPRQGGVCLALGVSEQNTAQRTAAVSKAYHAVFRIHIDAVLFYKPLRRQLVQLRQRSGLTLFL